MQCGGGHVPHAAMTRPPDLPRVKTQQGMRDECSSSLSLSPSLPRVSSHDHNAWQRSGPRVPGGYGFRGLRFGVGGFGFRVPGSGFRASSSRFRVPGFWFLVSGFGFWVSGFGSLVPVFVFLGFWFRVSRECQKRERGWNTKQGYLVHNNNRTLPWAYA